MRTQIENKIRRTYIVPIIEQIRLDNEISLALESEPPVYETSNHSNVPEYLNNDPFKNNIS